VDAKGLMTMTEAEYLDELERRAAAYIEALSNEAGGRELFAARELFSNMADVFTVQRLIAAKRELDALKAERSVATQSAP
jgi:hypothetical protein